MLPLEEIIARAPDGVLCCAPDGRIIKANRKAARILGYRSRAELARNLAVLSDAVLAHPKDQAALRLRLARRGALRNAHVAIRKASGGVAWLRVNARFLRAAEGGGLLLFQFNDITRQKLGEHRLRVQATTDALTGLYNRRQFDRLLARQIAEAQRYGDKLGLLFIDVDRFKEINDVHGHLVGDKVLRAIARRIAGSIRETDVCARIGGDEFCVLVNRIRCEEDMQALAQGIVRAVEQPLPLGGLQLHVRVSLGIAVYPFDGLGAEGLMEHADHGMYAMKRRQRGPGVLALA